MERLSISIDTALALEFDALIAQRGYRNRSEAIRDLVRSYLETARSTQQEHGHCVANLSYVYNHHERELAERLTALQHDQHDLTVATMHAHLDHDNCLESVILRGASAAVRGFADTLMAERGVRHGQLNLVSVDVGGLHVHGGEHPHAHPHPHPHQEAHPHDETGDDVRTWSIEELPHVHLKPKT